MTGLLDMIAGMDETWLLLAAAGAVMVLLLLAGLMKNQSQRWLRLFLKSRVTL